MKIDYKWIALSNTTLGMLMASVNQTILLISLPAIFAGLKVEPLGPHQASLLLWTLMSFQATTTVLLVTFGRIADMYGKVRFYNLGFVVFTLGALLCALIPSTGDTGAIELIFFRVVQGVGGALLFANSIAILTDAFPVHQRGLALGFNQLAFIGGSVFGVVLGGILAATNWRLIFLVSVPVGLFGTVWAYRQLREIGVRSSQQPDWWGNVTFALGLLALLGGITFAQVPYGGDSMGWGNPLVRAAIAAGLVLLALFAWIESRVPYPMFNLRLFTIRAFAAGNIASFLFALARGGLQFMLIIWLQGIWLPLHGVRFEDTPLRAGLATLPMMVGFTFFGPLGGWLSDRYGARVLATVGMLIQGLGFLLLTMLPVDFSMPVFALVLLLTGAGMGLFSAPNTSQIMSSVPPEYRGVAAGMRSTMLNAGMMASTAVFFTVVISRLSVTLPPALAHGLEQAGLPASLALGLAHLPAGSALFAALLGYNPFAHLLPPAVLASLGPAASRLVEPHFFAQLIAQPFIQSLRVAFFFSLSLCVAGAIASLLRGRRAARQVQSEIVPQALSGPVAVSGEPGRGS